MVRDDAELTDEVLALNVAYEAVHVGETESQPFIEGQ